MLPVCNELGVAGAGLWLVDTLWRAAVGYGSHTTTDLYRWHLLLRCCVPCRPRLKYHMDYCMEHPEELTKVAAVQKKVRGWHRAAPCLEQG